MDTRNEKESKERRSEIQPGREHKKAIHHATKDGDSYEGGRVSIATWGLFPIVF